MESLEIQGFTYDQRQGLLEDLAAVFNNCGAWVLGRKTVSPASIEFQVEIQLRSILDLYAGIVGTSLELTRPAHEALTDLCTRRKHRRITAELGCIVAIRIVVVFVDGAVLHSMLYGSASVV
jgi:hypothetical protein